MWTDGNGYFYIGDCRDQDRKATDAEVAAYEAAKPAPVPDPLTTLAKHVDDITAALKAKGVITDQDIVASKK